MKVMPARTRCCSSVILVSYYTLMSVQKGPDPGPPNYYERLAPVDARTLIVIGIAALGHPGAQTLEGETGKKKVFTSLDERLTVTGCLLTEKADTGSVRATWDMHPAQIGRNAVISVSTRHTLEYYWDPVTDYVDGFEIVSKFTYELLPPVRVCRWVGTKATFQTLDGSQDFERERTLTRDFVRLADLEGLVANKAVETATTSILNEYGYLGDRI